MRSKLNQIIQKAGKQTELCILIVGRSQADEIRKILPTRKGGTIILCTLPNCVDVLEIEEPDFWWFGPRVEGEEKYIIDREAKKQQREIERVRIEAVLYNSVFEPTTFDLGCFDKT